MKEGTCRKTSTGRRYCKRGGRVRFMSGTDGLDGRRRRKRSVSSVDGRRRISLGDLADMGISAIEGTPGTCMTAVRSKGGTQRVCFGARGRFVTPVAGIDGLDGRRRKTRKKTSRRKYL